MAFSWGLVVDKYSYDFDGNVCNIVKYHPWKIAGNTVLTGEPDLNKISYHSDAIHRSSDNIYDLLLHWITTEHLGFNNDSLVYGISRALKLEGAE